MVHLLREQNQNQSEPLLRDKALNALLKYLRHYSLLIFLLMISIFSKAFSKIMETKA